MGLFTLAATTSFLLLLTYTLGGSWYTMLGSIAVSLIASYFIDVGGIMKNKDLKTKTGGIQADEYRNMFGDKGEETEDYVLKRKSQYPDLVNFYYNLVTDFYEYGWGRSFHFAPRWIGESFQESIKRLEYFLASKMQLDDKSKCIDLGCGVSGPLVNIARFSGAKITGVTLNQYQVNRGNRWIKKCNLEGCKAVKADFLHLPQKDETFTHAYQIEATCHAPDRVSVFKEVFRVLKPGGYFAGLEWVMTDKYDPKNKDHKKIKEGIEVGNGLPTLVTVDVVVKALEDAGFEVVEHWDVNVKQEGPNTIPWWKPLSSEWTIEGFRSTPLGAAMTHVMCVAMEMLRLAPKGTTKVAKILAETAKDIAESGRTGIFTPSYYLLARKPIEAN